jgi:hypothetical protein
VLVHLLGTRFTAITPIGLVFGGTMFEWLEPAPKPAVPIAISALLAWSSLRAWRAKNPLLKKIHY